jgi:hypothetical protein
MTVYTLKATHKMLPEKVQIVQSKNNKVWLVNIPRTMTIPRYLTVDEFEKYYAV